MTGREWHPRHTNNRTLVLAHTHTHTTETGVAYLGSAGNHVLDEVTVTGGVDDGVVVLGRLELPQGNVDGDTTLTLGLQFVEDPGVLERALAHLGGLLLELLDGTLVNATALVDQVTEEQQQMTRNKKC